MLHNGIYIYEVGTKTKEIEQINAGWTEKDQNIKEDFLKIIKNGNKQSNIEKYELKNEEDLYIATKIAIDSYICNYSAEEIEEYYRAKSGITKELSDRIEKIISGAAKILSEETQKTSKTSKEITVSETESFQEDDVNSNYYSITYGVTAIGDNFLGYEVSVSATGLTDYLITNEESEENKTQFNFDENVFKIMIPSEYKDLEFEIEIKVTGKYKEENIYRALERLNPEINYTELPHEYVLYEEVVYRKDAESIKFTHEKSDEGENGEEDTSGGQGKPEQGEPDDGKQDTEKPQKNPDKENVNKQEDDKNQNEETKKNEEKRKEDTEVKEKVTNNINKSQEIATQKKLPRTRK